MAKKKRVKSKKRKPTKRRTNTMATTKKRRKKRTTTSAVRKTMTAPRKKYRKKKTGLGDGFNKKGFVDSLKTNGGGALGGGILLLTRLFSMNPWLRIGGGYAGSFGIAMLGAPSIGSGLAGASTYVLGEKLLGGMPGLLHDDMEDADYVDADTLSDSGFDDEDGNQVLVGEDNVLYTMNDDGELEAIGDGNDFDLAEDSDLQSVSMIPLQDAYSLSDSNNYALASGY